MEHEADPSLFQKKTIVKIKHVFKRGNLLKVQVFHNGSRDTTEKL